MTRGSRSARRMGDKVVKFHPEKCQVIRINLNRRFERQSNYRLHGHTLEVVDSGKYLGVHLTNDLTRRCYTCSGKIIQSPRLLEMEPKRVHYAGDKCSLYISSETHS